MAEADPDAGGAVGIKGATSLRCGFKADAAGDTCFKTDAVGDTCLGPDSAASDAETNKAEVITKVEISFIGVPLGR